MQGHYAFITHATADAEFANTLCEMMEERGIRCWIRPRDLLPDGTNFAATTLDAIRDSAALVLVLSESANESRNVVYEVDHAVDYGKNVFTVRIENVLPTKDLQFMSSSPWIDAWGENGPAKKQKVDELCNAITAEFSETEEFDGSFAHPDVALSAQQAKDTPLVFLSARSDDYGCAEEVHRFLTDSGVQAFFSHVSLPELGSSDYRREIDQALDDAHHMVVITSSRDNVLSQWVEAEWGFFINEKRSGRKPGNLITMLVGSMKIPELPPSLRYYEVITYGPEALEKLLRYVNRIPKA